MGGDVFVKYEIENMFICRFLIFFYWLEYINWEEMCILGYYVEIFFYVIFVNKNIESDVMVVYLFSEDG